MSDPSKHTPGPWLTQSDGRVYGPNGEYLGAFVWARLADTKLAVAAPDLLAALEPLARAVDAWEIGSRLTVEVSPPLLQQSVNLTVAELRAIKAALAKAKGGAA